MNIFLSSDNPRWTAHSEADLQSAIDSGILEETHWMDLKREINSGKSANRELARDLASFALDGGTLLVGIEETASGLTLVPQELDGLAGRSNRLLAACRIRP
ncbi:hypothetical protein [Amycolatopsis regifaucium]|uniref:hypothetical protein n=1 Tax=Amycolatopsis regifaucium TaxID=546365 RepID=UPI0011608BFC|nr:hypothetical protein [Amycolatopsis regifaucium]